MYYGQEFKNRDGNNYVCLGYSTIKSNNYCFAKMENIGNEDFYIIAKNIKKAYSEKTYYWNDIVYYTDNFDDGYKELLRIDPNYVDYGFLPNDHLETIGVTFTSSGRDYIYEIWLDENNKEHIIDSSENSESTKPLHLDKLVLEKIRTAMNEYLEDHNLPTKIQYYELPNKNLKAHTENCI